MNIIVLKSFISRLDFISKKIKYPYNNSLEINILNIDNNIEKIEGKAIIKNEINEIETITFNIQLSKSDDMLLFRTSYKSDKQPTTNEYEAVDTFAIVNQESKSFFTPKTKYLIHLVDGNIKQAYIVNKKYKFTNGINENYTKLNMDNKDVINSIPTNYNIKSNGISKR